MEQSATPDITTYLVPFLTAGSSHWVLAILQRRRRRNLHVRIYDSMSFAGGAATSNAAERLIGHAVPGDTEIHVEKVQCPQQSDLSSCGIFVLVFALFEVAGVPLPDSIDGRRWRELFLAWALETSLSSVQDSYSGIKGLQQDGKDLARITKQCPEVSRAIWTFSDPPAATAADLAETRIRDLEILATRTNELIEHTLRIENSRRDDVVALLAWVQNDVRPALSRLSDLAADTQGELVRRHDHVSLKVQQVRASINSLEAMRK